MKFTKNSSFTIICCMLQANSLRILYCKHRFTRYITNTDLHAILQTQTCTLYYKHRLARYVKHRLARYVKHRLPRSVCNFRWLHVMENAACFWARFSLEHPNRGSLLVATSVFCKPGLIFLPWLCGESHTSY